MSEVSQVFRVVRVIALIAGGAYCLVVAYSETVLLLWLLGSGCLIGAVFEAHLYLSNERRKSGSTCRQIHENPTEGLERAGWTRSNRDSE
jgi:uncharacterized membrane protein HdeD (DUF308 family)